MPLDDQARQLSATARRRIQADHDQTAGPQIDGLRDQGHGWRAIARILDAEAVPTPRGGRRWHPQQVQRISLRRAQGRPTTPTLPGPTPGAETAPDGMLRRLWRILRRWLTLW